MVYSLITILVALNTGAPDTAQGDYSHVVFKDGTSCFAFVVPMQNGWLKLKRDTPWAPRNDERHLADNLEVTQRRASKREDDLLEAGLQAGYVLTQATKGSLWVPAKDYSLAQQSAELVRESRQALYPPDAPMDSNQGGLETTTEQAPAQGIVRQWGGHVLLITITGILVILIWRRMISGQG